MTDELRNFLDVSLPKVKEGKKPKFKLGVSDSKIGSHIFEETKIPFQCNEFVLELIRGIHLHFEKFIEGLKPGDLEKAQLGLGHSYSRAKCDKSSMLDKAIECFKSLKMQVQLMSMGCGMLPMMLSLIRHAYESKAKFIFSATPTLLYWSLRGHASFQSLGSGTMLAGYCMGELFTANKVADMEFMSVALKVNEDPERAAGEASQHKTKENWAEDVEVDKWEGGADLIASIFLVHVELG
ncbi:NOP56-like pre RNA processing ribonucleoprotein [Artemisia annua]|uniref:NOP56-like pre RNA processing ribonucleoprotein n=1 Tax=Artemisia annua TaxID=35608 RepID=A0A2U1NCF3_ARTAN|nr:NOP56-like pre RNA processing ribonucleoprotein [Artemisia annua]